MAAPSSEDFGAQSFHDLDISAPAPQGGTPALRFESKAVEPGGGGGEVLLHLYTLGRDKMLQRLHAALGLFGGGLYHTALEV